jgi:predicted phosphoribosyltransferase
MFANRRSAGRRLASRLYQLREEKPVVLALPRGGVAVGFEIAEGLDAPLEIVLVRKIGVPWQPELVRPVSATMPAPRISFKRQIAISEARPVASSTHGLRPSW